MPSSTRLAARGHTPAIALAPASLVVKRVMFSGILLLGVFTAAHASSWLQQGPHHPDGRRSVGGALERHLAEVGASAAAAEACARALRAAVDEDPVLAGRALRLELGPVADVAGAHRAALLFVDGQAAAAARPLVTLGRMADGGVRTGDPELVAGQLVASSRRATSRLCAARDATLRAARLHRP